MIPHSMALAIAIAVATDDGVRLFEAQTLVLEPQPVAPGAQGELSLVVLERPREGTPLELSLRSPQVVLPENRLGWEHVADPQAVQPRIRARFVAPRQPGAYRVEGSIAYTACEATRCRAKRRAVVWTVVVIDPSS